MKNKDIYGAETWIYANSY